MKKIKFVVFLLNFLFSINLAVGANRLSENDVINVDGFSYIYNEGSLALCKGGKYSGEITIPETVRYEGYDYKVTGIKEGTFQSNQTITKVVMPNSILSIGDMAFFDCNGLSELSLPQNLKFIGSKAFGGYWWLPKNEEFPIVFYTENQLLTKSCPNIVSSRGTKMGQNLLKTYLAIFFHDVHVIKDLCYSFAKVHNYCETNEGNPLNLSFAVHFSSTCTDNGIFCII